MTRQVTTLADSIGGLSLADRTTPAQQTLVKAIRTLIQSCEATLVHLQQAEALVETKHASNPQDIKKLSSLRRTADALAKNTEAFSRAAEDYIQTYILSLADPGTVAQKLLSNFTRELGRIIRDVLDTNCDDGSVLREVLETCYSHALKNFGFLNSNLDSLKFAPSFAAPDDPESLEYYEHEDRLFIDECYATAVHAQDERKCEPKSNEEQQQEEEWIEFWVRALSNCPDGPTLFYSPASRLPHCPLADVPRYLFRAFDDGSSGINNCHIVASLASKLPARLSHSRVDLLSRPSKEVTQMLYSHLKEKSCFGGEYSDNLMSWSSSLLFVIQYAIWRCHQSGRDPASVQICMVDTRKFPHGQFARDLSLLRAYREAPELKGYQRDFFDFRLNSAYYDNGEYLSQVVLHHSGRSSVVSLEHLVDAGLHELYPEFADRDAMESCTNRAGYLRSIWSAECLTSRSDIQRAAEIARECFKEFDTLDGALLLLFFKNRTLRAPEIEGGFPNVPEPRKDMSNYGPDEVQRFMSIAETVVPKSGGISSGLRRLAHDIQFLGEVFECSERSRLSN